MALLSAGLLFKGDIYHPILGAAAAADAGRRSASSPADMRHVLLSAVHARVEASRLAVELDTALDTMHHGLCMLDADGLIAVVNDRAEAGLRRLRAGQLDGPAVRAR